MLCRSTVTRRESATLTRKMVVTAVTFVVAITLVALFAAAGATAAGPAGSGLTGVDAEDAPIDERAAAPLANETGTTDVIVRFTPYTDTHAEEDDVVDDLREHAADERSAFKAFAEDTDEVTVEREFWLASALLVSVDADAIAAADLRSVANVTGIHDNVVVATHETVGPPGGTTPAESSDPPASTWAQVETDPVGSHTAGLELVGAPAAWERFDTRGAGATVAVIDTGVDPAHQDITLAAWADFDENGTLVSDDIADAADPDGHGTHVAGTVAGGDASGTHIGVAPEATIHGLDAFDTDGTATFAGVLAAMEHATADERVDVLQMSLGANGTFRGFIAPVRNARASGAIVVAAAGNDGANTSSSPANVHDSLAVGAVDTDESRTVAEFSSGERILATAAFSTVPDDWPSAYTVPDVSAPGVAVVSAESGTEDGYVRRQGTSMAAPHVSGIAALALAATDGRIDETALQDAIVDTAIHPTGATTPDDRHGHGVVDAPAAVDAAVTAAPPPDPVPTVNGTDPADAEDPAVDDGAPGFGTVVAAVAVLTIALGSLVARVWRTPRDRRHDG